MSNNDTSLAEQLAAQIGELLAGHRPDIQGAVLADLTATWLAGHHGATLAATSEMRTEIFELHCEAIRLLVALYDGARSHATN